MSEITNPPAPAEPSASIPPAPMPGAEGAPPAKPKAGLALAALIVGIVSAVCAVIPGLSFVAFIPAIVAAVLGIVGLAKGMPGRGKSIAGVILGAVALLVAIVVSIATIVNGISAGVGSLPAPSGVTDNQPVPPKDEPADDPEPAAEVGTRTNPAPFGSTIEISDNRGPIWEITLGAPTFNANDQVAAENMFNDPPAEGFQYLLVPVTFTYVGDDKGLPWVGVQLKYVSAAGTTHTTSDAFVVAPNPISDINDLYTGASATGNLVIMVPSADVESGVIAISTFLSDSYFVALG